MESIITDGNPISGRKGNSKASKMQKEAHGDLLTLQLAVATGLRDGLDSNLEHLGDKIKLWAECYKIKHYYST